MSAPRIGEMWCVRCFKRPDEQAGPECRNPAWHTGHTCIARADTQVCRWCGMPIQEVREDVA